MKIENNALVVTVGGIVETVPLPTISINAKVKAWSVPTEYRESGLFVAVTQKGAVEEIPACDLAATIFLGEVEFEASQEAKLEAAKNAKRDEINAACDKAVASLAASYPEREVQSWPQQVKEAEALAADAQAPAPLLAAIAEARLLPLPELAARVLAKMATYAAASGALIGRRQAAEELIDAAPSVQDVASVTW